MRETCNVVSHKQYDVNNCNQLNKDLICLTDVCNYQKKSYIKSTPIKVAINLIIICIKSLHKRVCAHVCNKII
jgi:hypothetical protein